MEYNFLTNIEACYIDIPHLLYYSHIPAAIIALIFGTFILAKSKENRLAGGIFFLISFIFAAWVLIEGAIWLLYNSMTMMFLWSFLALLYSLLHILSIYFVYVFIDKKDVAWQKKLIFAALLLPVIVLTATKYNIAGFDIENCQAMEGNSFIWYRYFVGVISIAWIAGLIAARFRSVEKSTRKQVFLLGFGILTFLFLFSWSEIVGSLTENFNITQYGLFGMPILLGLLAYLIVQYHTFNIKLIATQALVWGLIVLVGSQFFFIQNPTNIILNSITFLGAIVFGYLLTKSVKREVEQRERLAQLNVSLRDLIKQRESLVHLITHKVKGSFTRTKFIFAGILDGTFGSITPEIKKIAEQGLEFDKGGIETVDLVLNVANLENGLIKYDMRQVDFKEIVMQTVEEKRLAVEAKGLQMELSIEKERYQILGDAFWLKEVVNNLIENSIKYTKEGKIMVALSDGGKVRLSVKDTGLGITEEDKKNLFTEGGRGKDSVKVNVDSTGYGLFTVKMIVEAHKGRVWAESEGAGKGSQFYVELPLP
jgi:signal transduction histidine kinase